MLAAPNNSSEAGRAEDSGPGRALRPARSQAEGDGEHDKQPERRLLAQWADMFGGNIALVDDFVTDDFVTHVAPLPWKADVGETAGREAFKRWLSGGLRLLIPDMRFSADVGPIADEHYLVIRWKVEGTYNEGFPGSSPDAVGRTVAITGTDIVRIEDGKFAEYWLDVDSLFSCSRSALKRYRRWHNGTPRASGQRGRWLTPLAGPRPPAPDPNWTGCPDC